MVEINTASTESRACWNRLVEHEFGGADQQRSFTSRLAKENGWSLADATQVIDEYKRFCFLAIHADHPVAPSAAVDKVWHQHLIHSQDYWERFCPEVLGQSLHHNPSAGGRHEAAMHRDWYSNTLNSYRHYFGFPSSDIWPSVETRFASSKRSIRLLWGFQKFWAWMVGSMSIIVLIIGILANGPWSIIFVTMLALFCASLWKLQRQHPDDYEKVAKRYRVAAAISGLLACFAAVELGQFDITFLATSTAICGMIWWSISAMPIILKSDSSSGFGGVADSNCSGCGGCGGG